MRTYAKANEEQLFVKKEAVGQEGVMVRPDVTDRVLAVGVATTGQERELLEDEQIRGQRSRMSPLSCWVNPGEWSFTTYVKPSGVVGTKPEVDVLLEAALGRKCLTNSPAACANWSQGVLYVLDSSLTIPSFSLWRKVGTTVFAMMGCTVETLEISIAGDAIASLAWSGSFMRQFLAGESTLSQTEAKDATTLHVTHSKRFSDSNIRISVGDNTPATGYLITSIDYETDIITISPGLAEEETSGATVKGWYPTSGAVDTKKPICGKMGVVTIDTSQCVVLTATITLTNNIKYYIDEKNGLAYATAYGAPTFRDVNGTLTMYYAPAGSRYFYKADKREKDALIVPAGDVSGNRMRVFCPQIEYKAPVLSGDEEVMIELPFDAVGSAAGDDELRIAFD